MMSTCRRGLLSELRKTDELNMTIITQSDERWALRGVGVVAEHGINMCLYGVGLGFMDVIFQNVPNKG